MKSFSSSFSSFSFSSKFVLHKTFITLPKDIYPFLNNQHPNVDEIICNLLLQTLQEIEEKFGNVGGNFV